MENINITTIIALVALSVSILSIYLSYKNNLINRKMANDEKLFKELTIILNRAYEKFSGQDTNRKNNQEMKYWRNSARLILSYLSLKEKIKTDMYKSLCNTNEEFYRLQFHLVLVREKEIKIHGLKDDTDRKAMAMIVEFSKVTHWKKDPLSDIDLKKMIEKHKLYEFFPNVFSK